VGGYRNHYLRFQTPATWYHLQQAGFNYDTTFGYNDMPGFRNGMGHPFQPYDDHRRRAIELLEIPLHIMDSSLLTAGGSPAGAWTIIRELVEQVRSCRGVLTVLWHNDVFSCPFKQSSARLYRQLLAYGREQGAWLTSGTEIWRWATNAGIPAERSER